MNVRTYCDILIWWCMLYYHIFCCCIVILSYCHIVLSCWIVILLCCCIEILSYCHIVLWCCTVILLGCCCKPPRYVLYNFAYVLYDGTFGASDQGQTLDVWQGEDSQIHHLIWQIRRFTISSFRKKLNQKRYRRIRISTTILDHTDRN